MRKRAQVLLVGAKDIDAAWRMGGAKDVAAEVSKRIMRSEKRSGKCSIVRGAPGPSTERPGLFRI